jgi:glutamate dehydrogenase
MQNTVYAQKMLEQLQANPGQSAAEQALFRRFVQALGKQLRAPFTSTRSPAEALKMVTELWPKLASRGNSAPVVDAPTADTLVTWMADQPFIVDTGRLALARCGVAYEGGFNVIIPIGRDEQGALVRVDDPQDPAESIVRIELGSASTEALAQLRSELTRNLTIAQAVAADFGPMLDALDAFSNRMVRRSDVEPSRGEELREAAELLRWLQADNFIFTAMIVGDERLGTARAEHAELWDTTTLEQWADGDTLVTVRKAGQESPIHRAGRLDELRFLIPGAAGEPSRSLVVQGLFTYRAITRASRHVPVLRRMLATILTTSELRPGSFRYKGTANAFDALPNEFLFTAEPARVATLLEQVMEAEAEQDVRAQLVPGRDGASLFVLVAVPRDRWSDPLRARLSAKLVEATGATSVDHGAFNGRYQTLLVHFYLTGTRSLSADESASLQDALVEIASPWQQRVWTVLKQRHGEDRADQLLFDYGNSFGELTIQRNSPERAASAIEKMERLRAGSRIEIELITDGGGPTQLRILQARDIILSDILPVLDQFGVRVIDQDADPVCMASGQRFTMDTFRLAATEGLTDEEVLSRGDLLADGLRAVFEERMQHDGLNALLLRAGIPWQAVDLLRAYNGYARQLGLRLLISRVRELMLSQPKLVGMLWAYFEARFNPDAAPTAGERGAAEAEACNEAILKLTDHDQDRLFRALFNLMEATIRTNFYRTDKPEHYISFKVLAAKVKMMEEPKLKYEIYVHHREVEGVHLRGSDIARGGIRWSDREDYRREVLDLATTQMVKNVIIVPEGAKGGFYIRHNPGDRHEQRQRADRLYQILVRGMLDVTDNYTPSGVQHPPRVVTHDGNDPYLVVAADKGTAHLSDTANGISRSYGFWLDDAFASGGSNGYDHKKVGITAKGGWMTVRRLLAETGIDAHTQTFTCVGIGDPSGDVLGNGVIEHRTMKLVGCFNHMHIFIDPEPDPERSFEERLRLFNEVKGWDHYDTSALSPGGGVFNRRAKSIKLSPQIKQLLGVLQDELAPDMVIRLLLRLNVDLLWNGGIGTYVKATTETNADAGDLSNDDVRVNGNELRCKVIGEGGNLGFTQRGRIEYALAGGRLNTDFIDNSGGVDMSDHEVNLKILLNPMVTAGSLSLEGRNTLLESLTDQVAADVLANNDRHGRQLSLDQVRSSRDPLQFSRTIDWVCRLGGTSREALRLPTDDVLRRRAAANQGITRPELAVLQAHVKMHIFKSLRDADPSRVPAFGDRVRGYFPRAVVERFPAEVDAHMLHTSIGMTVVTNEIIGENGALFFPMVAELTGAPIVEIARTWTMVMEGLQAGALKAEVFALPPAAAYPAWVELTDAVQHLCSVWLAPGEPGADKEPMEPILAALNVLRGLPGTAHSTRLEARVDALLRSDVPAAIATKLAGLSKLTTAREVVRTAGGRDLTDAAVRYLAVGEASRLLPAIRALEARRAESGWDPIAIGILRGRYIRLLRELAIAVEVDEELSLGVDRVATRLALRRLAGLREMVDHILGDQPGIPALLVAEERVRGWLARELG